MLQVSNLARTVFGAFPRRPQSSFANFQRRKPVKHVPVASADAKSMQLKGMVSKIVFRAGPCTVAQLEVDVPVPVAVQHDEPPSILSMLTLRSTNNALNGQEVGDHVEVQGGLAFSVKLSPFYASNSVLSRCRILDKTSKVWIPV